MITYFILHVNQVGLSTKNRVYNYGGNISLRFPTISLPHTYHKAAWDEESKQRQSEHIMIIKPWLKSTGAKTAEGKTISKMNALKTNPELHNLIKEYKQFNETTKRDMQYNKLCQVCIRCQN